MTVLFADHGRFHCVEKDQDNFLAKSTQKGGNWCLNNSHIATTGSF